VRRALRAPLHEDAGAAIMWRRRVAEFTHDWLRNRFLPRVHAWIAITGADAEARPNLVETLVAGIREWDVRGDEALMLSEDYCEIMSPRRFIDDVAIHLPSDVGEFLRRTAFACWNARHRIDSRVEHVRSAHARVDTNFRRWNASARAHEAVIALNGVASECEALIAALSALPTTARL